MVLVLPHVKIAWGGSIGAPAGAEVWTNSLAWAPKDLNMSGVIADGLPRLQAQMDGLTTAIQNWFQTPITNQGQDGTLKGAGIAPAAKLEWVKLNALGSDGKYLFASNTFFYPTPIPGGGTFTTGFAIPYRPPWQMTTAITLRTTVARGRGSRGRIYPPLAGAGPETDAEPWQPVFSTNQMCNAFTGLIDNINSGLYMSSTALSYEPNFGANINSHSGNCVIVSTSPTTGPHAGAAPLLTPILRVEVDRTADVQTRRVNRIPRSTTGAQSVTLNT